MQVFPMANALKELTDVLGGPQTLGRSVHTRSDLMDFVREGFPFEVLESVIRLTNMTREEVETLIALPARTLTRRKQAKHLQPVESDRLFRVARVAAHAIAVLGSPQKAAQWLHRANRGLGGNSPITYLDTDIGAEQVNDILTRLEHGVVG